MAEGGTVTVSIQLHALSVAGLLGRARTMMAMGQCEGMIPTDRTPVDASEECVFAWSRRETVGCAVFYGPEDHDFLWLDVLYVLPSWRRRGIGETLARKVLAEAAARGLKGVKLGTDVGNERMRALAERIGFRAEAIVMTSVAPAAAGGLSVEGVGTAAPDAAQPAGAGRAA